MSNDRLARALDHCLYALQQGATVEECLQHYASLRNELTPLLYEADRLASEPVAVLLAEQRSMGRRRLMTTIARPAERPRGRWAMRVLVPAAGLALVALVAVLALSIGRPADNAEAATVLTVLQGDVQVETPAGLQTARNGMVVRAGEQVVTGAGGRAVLTFFEGSTVTLENDTTVVIRSVADENGRLKVLLAQQQGSTWTHVPMAFSQADVEIDTPNAKVQTKEASFATTVDRAGSTRVGASSGALNVRSGSSSTEVRGGGGALIERLGQVVENRTAEKSLELVLTVRGPVYAFVTDANGATVGRVAPGVPVNQVPGASVRSEEGLLVIRIPDPAAGGYRLGVTGRDSGDVTILAALRGAASAERSTGLRIARGESWRADLRVGDTITVGTIEHLADGKPSSVTVPQRAADRARTPIVTATSTPARPSTASTPTRPTATPTRPGATATATPVR